MHTSPGAGTSLAGAPTIAPYVVALAVAAVFSFLSGGYVIGRSTLPAVAFLCAAAVWVWFLRRTTRPPVLFLAALAVFGIFAAWSGFSVLWSFGPDLTWVSFNLTAFYLAVVAVLGLTPVDGLQLRTVAYGYLALATAVGLYAFLGKAWPDVVTHAHANARLDDPVGYWNVLAVMMVMGLVVALAVAGDGAAGPILRTAAAVAAVPMCFAFFFTFSRGGWLVLALALVLYFGFTTTRLASVVSLAAIATPVALVLWRLRGLETLYATTADDALRALQGGALFRWAIAAVVVAGGAQLAAALFQREIPWPRWSSVAAGSTVFAVILIVVVGGSARFVLQQGGVSWVKDRAHALVTDAESEQGGRNAAGRLLVLTTNGRIPLWREALEQSRVTRLAGTGAGTFPFTHYRFRDVGGVVKHAHGQWFNVLSELGVVGLALFSAAIALFVAAMIGNPFSRSRDALHPVLVALQAGVIAFFVHMAWDWDWDMAAVGMVAFIFVAACVSYRSTRRARDRRPEAPLLAGTAAAEVVAGTTAAGAVGLRSAGAGWAPRVVASAALLLLAASWLPPYFALRAENAALAAASDGDVQTALDDARRAATWDPLAVSPLLTQAKLLQQLGRSREALERLETAARLQPQNHEVWYELGLLLHGVFGRDKAASAAFTRALGLNPAHGDSRYELDRLGRRTTRGR